jgi:serine phosphatase RsbU (regulator of sigma subunit)
MGQLRIAVRAYALERSGPAEILEGVNSLVHRLELASMVTTVCAALDPATGELRIASAGHLPPLVVSCERAVRTFETGRSIPLDVDAAARYTEAEERLDAGEILILYTDGLVERTQGTLEEGLRRLQELVAQGPRHPDALCDHIIEAMLRGADRPDDVAVLAVQRLGSTGRSDGAEASIG